MNFLRLIDNKDVAGAFKELQFTPYWNVFTVRQDVAGSPHKDTRCIPLYAPEKIDDHTIFNELNAYETIFVKHLPNTLALFDSIMDDIGWCEIGRVMLANLKAGGRITPHIDEGAYADYYTRIHCVISSEEGNLFHCGGESLHMKPGEVWLFDHKAEHSVENNSDKDRIHLIFDIRRN